MPQLPRKELKRLCQEPGREKVADRRLRDQLVVAQVRPSRLQGFAKVSG